jgi:type I restriction enzyme, S subunit
MLSEVPEGWVGKALGDICTINMGQSPKSSDVNDEQLGIPFLQGCTEFGDYVPTPKAWIKEPLKVAEEGDILFSVRAPVGKMNIAPVQLCIGRGLCAINSNSAEQSFLRFLLAYIAPKISSQSQGSTFQAVNKKQIHEAPVLLPPLNEQQRIAEVLSSVDESIQATQAVIEQAERVKRGLMEELLTGGLGSQAIERGEVPEGWEGTTFGRQIDFKGGNQPPKSTFVYEPTDGYVRLLQIRDFENDDKPAYIPAGATKVRCTKKDILIARYGASLGRICRGKEGAYNVALVKLMLSDKLYSDFTYYWLNGEHFQNFLARVGSRSAQAGFNKDDLAPLSLAIPPLTEQKRIAEILSSVDETIASHKANIEQQSLVKKGLMDDLLTGKVRTV